MKMENTCRGNDEKTRSREREQKNGQNIKLAKMHQ